MNVLVLGGSGYLGSKVVRRLVEDGHHVVCTKRASSDLSRVKDLEDAIEWIPDPGDGAESMRGDKADLIINTACDYGRGGTSPGPVFDANMVFPLRVLNRAAESGTRTFLTIGTSLPDRLNPYSFSKYVFSEIGSFFAQKTGMNFYNLRLEMFYGPDEPNGRFLSSVIRKMLAGSDVATTAGTQKRDIIAVQDVVEAIELIINSGLEGYHDIPVGTGVAPTIGEIVDFIWEETRRRSSVAFGAVPMREDEPDCIADTSVLESIGQWRPLYWKDGIRQMIDTIRNNIGMDEKQDTV